MDRRAFIKLTAVTGTSAAVAGCGVPEHELIRFVPDEDLVPGVAEWKPSVCPGCASACGLLARVMEADVETVRNGQRGVVRMGVAKKLEGNDAHPVNQGGLCARGQAAIQITYHPDRITQPLERSGDRGSGRFQPIEWDEALSQLLARLDELAASGAQGGLAFLTRRRAGHRHDLIAAFLERFGAPPPVVFDVFDEAVLRRANELSFGRPQLPTFDLARTRMLVSFGADFLGTWNSPVAQNAAYGRMRQGRPGVRGRFVQIESRMSQSGANADEWIPIAPGTDGILALGLAHVLMKDGRRAGAPSVPIEGWTAGLADYTPERVSARTGVAAPRIERLARELAELSPAVVMIGGPPLAHTNGLFHAVAVNALNALLGSVEQPGGVYFTPRRAVTGGAKAPAPRTSERSLSALLAESAQPKMLMIDGGNPVFGAPRAWKVDEAFRRVPFIASFSSFIDETSALADLILPDHSFLESWVDAAPESGSLVPVVSVAAPAMKPLHRTRAMPDVLLEVARRLKQPLNPAFAWQTFDEMMAASFAALPAAPSGDDAWTVAQKQGGWWDTTEGGAQAPPPQETAGVRGAGARGAGAGVRGAAVSVRGAGASAPAAPVAFAAPEFDGSPQEFPFHFLPYASMSFNDGSLAHLPWLQELPDPLTSAMWSSWIEVNPKTAERLGVALGDMVEVASRHGSLRAPVVVSPGIAPDVVAMPVGQGHRTFTRFASGRGANPLEILAPMVEKATGALAWAATRVKVTRVSEGHGELILFAGGMHEHPHEHER